MNEPDYAELLVNKTGGTVYSCQRCGALVHDRMVHDVWHRHFVEFTSRLARAVAGGARRGPDEPQSGLLDRVR